MRVAALPSDLLKTRLERFTRALHGLEKGDISALHRARVASRRLRELVPVLQLPSPTAKKLSRRLRKVTRRLGSVRELDVMLLAIDRLHASHPKLHHALRRLRTAVVREREEARERLAERMPVDAVRRVAKKLERVRVELHRSEDARRTVRQLPGRLRVTTWATDARLTKRANRLASAIRAAGAVYLPERLHDVRLALKKLRYVVELSAELDGQKHAAELRALKRGQDLLGRMHDLEVLIVRVRDLQASLTPPSLTAWRDLDALLATLEDMCRRLHARYVHEREPLAAVAAKYAAVHVPPGARSERRAG